MSKMMEKEIKRWTARRKSALGLEIVQGKTTTATASRHFDLNPAGIESWVGTASAAWRLPCAPSLRACVHNTSGS
ncbi:hypothetical protein [Stenotrophomonas maltophilia]|uniref:hypothetical protein n=1 Tax=Stenotrophomonas maltophilia TaxID=40324 RepID=UPI000A71B917|nr:hypothetical protein [Stenotrophomonas maltophilia]MCO7495707.1 hypothetical protein [Stenotrophomonas maltophilia]